MDMIVKEIEKWNGWKARLTTESPASRDGIPVLRVGDADGFGDYGPADVIDTSKLGGVSLPAAVLVQVWTLEEDRTAEERKTANRYLSQWPEGPQVGPYFFPLREE